MCFLQRPRLYVGKRPPLQRIFGLRQGRHGSHALCVDLQLSCRLIRAVRRSLKALRFLGISGWNALAPFAPDIKPTRLCCCESRSAKHICLARLDEDPNLTVKSQLPDRTVAQAKTDSGSPHASRHQWSRSQRSHPAEGRERASPGQEKPER